MMPRWIVTLCLLFWPVLGFGQSLWPTENAPEILSAPIYAAGDGNSLWISQPVRINGKTPGFGLIVHQLNKNSGGQGQSAWTTVRQQQNKFFNGQPAALAVNSQFRSGNKYSRLAVLFSEGLARNYSATASTSLPRLPEGLTPKAAMTGPNTIYVLAEGRYAPVPATLPAEPITNNPTTATTATASAPATSQPGTGWYLLSLQTNRWEILGQVANETSAIPRNAEATMAWLGDRVLLAWTDPGKAMLFHYATAEAARGYQITLNTYTAQMPIARLHAVVAGAQVLILWAQAKADKSEVELYGLALDNKGVITRTLPALGLGKESKNINPATQVAVAPLGNLLAAVYSDEKGQLYTRQFDPNNQPIGEAKPVTTNTNNNALESTPSIVAMILPLILLTIAFGLSRQRATEVVIPSGAQIAAAGRRALAAAIDIGLPFILVISVYGLWEPEALAEFLANWRVSWYRPDVFVSYLPLTGFVIVYFIHCVLGEAINGGSLGKRLLGLRVTNLTGQRATLVQILIRNVLKIYEVATLVLIIYPLFNEHRYRIGDLLAGTVVLEPIPPAPTERRDDDM
jgi:uncharacterized RDD family membrane protein YckC